MNDSEAQEDELLALQAIFCEAGYLKLSSVKYRLFDGPSHKETTYDDNKEAQPSNSCSTKMLHSGDFSAQVHLPDMFQIRGRQAA